MTPDLVTETAAATFEALGYPMMTRAARLCVQTCATYAQCTAAAMLPLGTEYVLRNTRNEAERYTATQAMTRAVSAGNALVRAVPRLAHPALPCTPPLLP